MMKLFPRRSGTRTLLSRETIGAFTRPGSVPPIHLEPESAPTGRTRKAGRVAEAETGEAIDWEKEGIEESVVGDGLKRLQLLIPKREGSTETADAPPPEPPSPPPPRPPPPPRERTDRCIGDFRLVRKLGEGGMGVVDEAEQEHHRRPVALKVIRGGAHVSPDTCNQVFSRGK